MSIGAARASVLYRCNRQGMGWEMCFPSVRAAMQQAWADIEYGQGYPREILRDGRRVADRQTIYQKYYRDKVAQYHHTAEAPAPAHAHRQ